MASKDAVISLVGYQEPYWRTVMKDIRRQIDAGLLKPGDKLPSTKELCEKYETSAITVRHAVSTLIEQDILTGKSGVGVFVAEPKS